MGLAENSPEKACKKANATASASAVLSGKTMTQTASSSRPGNHNFSQLVSCQKAERESGPAQQVKKDAMWKPLLRNFRRFLKDRATKVGGEDSSAELFNIPVNGGSPIMSKAYGYFDALDLPAELRTERNVLALLLVVESQHVTKKRQLIPECAKIMQPFLPDIYLRFFHIFNENCKRSRVEFFRDPFVQTLWRFFVQSSSEFGEFFEQLKVQKDGGMRVKRLLVDITAIELELHFNIVP